MDDLRFAFFESYWRALGRLGDAELAAIVRAMCAYAFDGEEPELDGVCALAWDLIRPNVDKSLKAVMSGGSKGPADAKRKAPSEAPRKAPKKAPSEAPRKAAREGACDGGAEPSAGASPLDKDKEKDMDKDREVECSRARARAHPTRPDPLGEPYRGPAAPPPMAAPSPADVAAYVAAQGAYPIDAERFCGHYASVGWRDKQGRPYADWRPLALMWSRGDRDRRAAEEREGAGRDDFSDLDRGV